MKHDLTPQNIKLTDLRSLKGNPRQGDIGAISQSIETNGIYQPIIVNRGTHTGRPFEIIAGNHRAQAMKHLGHETVPAIILDVTEEQALKIALADNRTGDLADYDREALLDMLHEVGDLSGTGYDLDYIDDLMNSMPDLDSLAEEWDGTGMEHNLKYSIKIDNPEIINAWKNYANAYPSDQQALALLIKSAS